MARRSGLFLIGLVLIGAFFLLRTGSPTPGEAAITLYGVTADAPSNLYSISPANGAASLIGEITGFDDISAIAFRPSTGVLYGIGFDSDTNLILLTINTSTGAGTSIGALGITTRRATDMSFQPSTGTLFAHLKKPDSSNSGEIYTVNISTGAATFVGQTGIGQSGNGLAFNIGGTLYLAAGPVLYTVDTSSGVATFAQNLGEDDFSFCGGDRINAMDVQPGTGTMFGSVKISVGGYNLATVATSDGAVADVGTTVDNLDAIAFVPILAASPTPTRTATGNPTATVTATVTQTVVITDQRQQSNVSAVGAALESALAARARAATPSDPGSRTGVTAGSIAPPNTGNAGLAPLLPRPFSATCS